MFNAFIISKYTACTHNKSYLLFRQQLARELIGDYNTRKRKSISVSCMVVVVKLCGIVLLVKCVCVIYVTVHAEM